MFLAPASFCCCCYCRTPWDVLHVVAVVVEVVVVAVEAIVVAIVVVLVVVVRGSGTIYSCCVKVHQQRRCKNRRPLGPLVKIIYVALDVPVE